MVGLFQEIPPPRKPNGWTVVCKSPTSSEFGEIIDWLLGSGALTRGAICLSKNRVHEAIGILGQEMGWQMFKSTLPKRDVVTGEKIVYPLEMAFASEEDAMLFEMKF